MEIRIYVLLICLVARIFFCAHAASATDKSSVKTLELTQRQFILGDIKVFSQHDAVKFVTASKTYAIAKAPDWKVVFYDPATKAGCAISYERFVKGGLDGWNEKSPSALVNWPVVNPKPDNIVGLPCTHYTIPFLNRQRKPTEHGKAGDYWTITDSRVAEQSGRIMQMLTELPVAKGIPIKAKVYEGGEKERSYTAFGINGEKLQDSALLETSAAKATTCGAHFFDVPRPTKWVSDPMQVLYNAKQKKQINEFAQEFGFSKDK